MQTYKFTWRAPPEVPKIPVRGYTFSFCFRVHMFDPADFPAVRGHNSAENAAKN